MFMHPWAIAMGLLAAGLPLAIHFLTRPKPRMMPFSGMRFLREVLEERKTRYRLRDVLVLALRMLAVALLGAAIARPLLDQTERAVAEDHGQVVRVVILDVSQSMAALNNGIRLLDRARPQAARHLEQRQWMRANLIFAGARPAAVYERPSSSVAALHEELAQVQPLPQEARVQPTLNLAAEMLAESAETSVRSELIIISDFQRSNWASADFSVLPTNTRIELESVAPAEPAPNLGILRFATAERPETGGEFKAEIDIGNYSPTPRTVTVQLTLGTAAQQVSGLCAPYSKTTLVSNVASEAVGWHSGQARLLGSEDGLPEDNVRPFVVEVRPPASIVLLTRQSVKQRPSSSYYLERGLAPADESSPDRSALKVTRLDPGDLDRESLSAADLIAIDHPGKLSPEAAGQLGALLRRGRGILYVAAEPVDATNLRQLIDATDKRLQLPAEFLPPPGDRPRRDLSLSEVRRRQPPFQVFGDDLDRLIAPLRISGGLETRLVEGAVQEDLYAQCHDRSAFLAFASSDAGRMIVMNADLGASNLPSSPIFVPLLGELVRLLAGQRDAGHEVPCGEPFVVPLPPAVDSVEGLLVRSASDDASGIGAVSRESGEFLWKGEATGAASVHRVMRNGTTVSAIATVIPAAESDLRGLSADVFTNRLAGGRDVRFHSFVRQETSRQDWLWSWLAVGCIACFLGEIVVLKAFRT